MEGTETTNLSDVTMNITQCHIRGERESRDTGMTMCVEKEDACRAAHIRQKLFPSE